MLMHHAYAQLNSIAWSRDMDNFSVNQNLATIGTNHTIQDVHERRFTCTVLAHKRMYLALTHREIDVIVGDNAGPCLADVTHFDRVGNGWFLYRFYHCAFLHMFSNSPVRTDLSRPVSS